MKKFLVVEKDICICLDNIVSFRILTGITSPYVVRVNFDVKDRFVEIPCKTRDDAVRVFNQIVESLK